MFLFDLKKIQRERNSHPKTAEIDRVRIGQLKNIEMLKNVPGASKRVRKGENAIFSV